jgi:hypothetical protein
MRPIATALSSVFLSRILLQRLCFGKERRMRRTEVNMEDRRTLKIVCGSCEATVSISTPGAYGQRVQFQLVE